MTVTHNNAINITILLDPASSPTRGFGNLLYLVPVSENSLDGDRVRKYDDIDAVEADLVAGDISAATRDGAQVYFGQQPTPQQLLIGQWDDDETTGEDISTALTAVRQADSDFYAVAVQSRDPEDIVDVASAVEAGSRELFVCQSNDTELLDSGWPTALAALEGNERTIICYHPDNGESMDVGLAGARLPFNPDDFSAPWYCQVRLVTGYADQITAGQRDEAANKGINVGLRLGPSSFFVKRGHTAARRPIYMMVTLDWFRERISQDAAREVVKFSDRGQKIPVSRLGQRIMGSLVEARMQQGQRVGHFKDGQTRVLYPTITQTDLNDELIRVNGEATMEIGGQDVTMNFHFVRDDIIEE